MGVALSPEYIFQFKPGSIFPDFERYGVLWMIERARYTCSISTSLANRWLKVRGETVNGMDDFLVDSDGDLKILEALNKRLNFTAAYLDSAAFQRRIDQNVADHQVVLRELGMAK